MSNETDKMPPLPEPVAWMFPLGNGAKGLSFEQSCSTDTPLYTHPAPKALAPDAATQPVQADEVIGLAETIRSELERLRKFTPPVSGLWDELYANVDGRIDELVAAFTQRPAAPLATAHPAADADGK